MRISGLSLVFGWDGSFKLSSLPRNSLITGKIQGKTADFADVRACHLDFGKENSGLGAISLNLLTGKFCTVISELVTTNREKSVAAFWPTVSYQILAPA